MNVSKKRIFLYLIISTFILCFPAFFNKFPLLFPDTLGYIRMGFQHLLTAKRVWLYGGFLRHASLNESLWLVVLVQGFLLSWLVFMMFKYFFAQRDSALLFLFYMLGAAMTTAASFHTSMLMPDIFTPMMLLSACLLLFARGMSRLELVLVAVLFIFSAGMHNAHFLIVIGLAGLVWLGAVFKKNREWYNDLGISIKKMLAFTGLVLLTHLFVCTVHYSVGGKFVSTRGGEVFLFARLCDFGLAQAYLNENCAKLDNCPVCPYVKDLRRGREFLWLNNSVLKKTGGWTEESVKMYGDLSMDILTTPKYFKKFVIRSIEATFMLFFHFEYSCMDEIRGTRAAVKNLKKYFPTYDIEAQESKQVKGHYPESYSIWNNMIQTLVLSLSALLLLLMLSLPNYSKQQKAIVLFIFLGLVLNAFVSGASSGIYPRYQSRVAWLITLPAFWFACSMFEQWLAKKQVVHSKEK